MLESETSDETMGFVRALGEKTTELSSTSEACMRASAFGFLAGRAVQRNTPLWDLVPEAEKVSTYPELQEFERLLLACTPRMFTN